MKKLRSIVIILVLLAILIGAYSYIKLNPKQEEIEATTTKEKIELLSLDSEAVVKVELFSDKPTLTIQKEDDIWVVNDRSDAKISQDLINSIVKTFSSIDAELLVEENATDLSIYGLDKPQKAIITSSDAKLYTILIGNETPTGSGYYFINEGQKTVYTVSYTYATPFDYTFEDLVEKEKIVDIDSEKLSYIYIAQKGKPEIEATRLDDTELDEYEMWNSLATWKMTKPYINPRSLVSNDILTNLTAATTGFNTSVKSFVENNPKDLSIYGLDEPELELWFKDSDNLQTHLFFGKQTEEGTVYFKQADSTSIYTMSTNAIDLFMNTKAFDVVDKFAMLISIEDINKIVITKDGKPTTFDITVTKQKDESDKETTTISCSVDGKEYPEDDFKKLYQNFIGLMLDLEYKGDKVTGTPEISIAFHMINEKVLESKYYKYDDKYYIFDKNGTQEFLISKRQFDNVFERMSDFFEGTIVAE